MSSEELLIESVNEFAKLSPLLKNFVYPESMFSSCLLFPLFLICTNCTHNYELFVRRALHCNFLNCKAFQLKTSVCGPHVIFLRETEPWVLLARDSLLMAAFTVVFSLINRSLMQRVTAAPQTISVIVSGTVGNRVGQLLFLNNDPLKSAAFVKGEQDSETIVRTNSKNNSPSEAWFIFGKILDFTLLLVYVKM
ncbi:hypothetical protein NQ317_015071 [Molorchus minor]|uniref:Uncharacterized protein n=1 Tax=Molorchus minor TaxID=1323400 RepID=A0ABQ9JN00_9CUCU|nr:hypothetical protein NQ317_015071 [Molorchus minor]